MNKSLFHIILGTAHLDTTPGKCAPDRSIREAIYSRERIAAINKVLKAQGYNTHIDYPDLQPNSLIKASYWKTEQTRELQYRVKVVNDLCRKYGAANCLYVSIHLNAAGNGGPWMNAGGWAAYTTVGKTNSDIAAEHIYVAAEYCLAPYVTIMAEGKKKGIYSKAQRPFRTDTTDGDRDLESNFYVIKHTSCPAVLTENLFQDNRSDVAFLLSDEGKAAIEQLHIDGIKTYIASL